MALSGQGLQPFPLPLGRITDKTSITLVGVQMISHKRLKEVLHYDPQTGLFKRIGLSGDRVDLVGKRAGGPTSDGYQRIAVDNFRRRAHTWAWLYMTGEYPKDEIDHRNGNRSDNSWTNLRASTSKMNKQNRRSANKGNKTGFLGVSLAPANKFKARIDHAHLGVFDTPEEAHAAYLKAKRKLHKGCTI